MYIITQRCLPTLVFASVWTLSACQTTTPRPDFPEAELAAGELSAESAPSTPTTAPVPQEESNEAHRPHAGNWEVTLSGIGANDDDFNAGGGQVAASAGYFLTDHIEVLFRQNLAYADPGVGSSDVWNGSSRVAVDFHIPLGPVVPFVGGNIGYVYGDTVNETFAAAPEVGIKWYLVENAFLQATGEYQFFFDDAEGIDEGFDNGSFVYGVGIGLRF